MSRNVAASVHARLSNQARETGRPFQEVLELFALERFLFRLAASPHRKRFILKGGLLLRAWNAPITRPTRDIDLLAHGDATIASMEALFREICELVVEEEDGMVFRGDTVRGIKIKEGMAYEGVRIGFDARLGPARVPMQIDLGFGDIVHPRPAEVDYPSALGFPRPRLRAYPRETMIAEKLQAMIDLGLANSRMKDFYDIWLLARQFDFEGTALSEAIAKTFEHRGTSVPSAPMCLSTAFSRDSAKQVQWRAFRRKSRLDEAPQELEDLIDAIEPFVGPITRDLAAGRSFVRAWRAPGPWA